MATSGTNYTAKWQLQDGILIISPISGNSGKMLRDSSFALGGLENFITLTNDEWISVTEIRFIRSVAFLRPAIIGEPVPESSFANFFRKAVNVEIMDVTGLDITYSENVNGLFSCSNLTTIIGLSELDVSRCINFRNMFAATKLTSIDISAFSANVLNNAEDVSNMFSGMNYCSSITLPAGFQRTYAQKFFDNEYNYHFGITEWNIQATKDDVTISSDEDFFKLTATSQGGTWTRDISGSADLRFYVNKVERNGYDAEITYTYYSISATVEIYLKESGQSSFPSTPSSTFTIEGTGTNNKVTLTLTSDNAYDVMIKVSDSETNLYLYPSIDSNKLLLSIDDEGNVKASGNVEDGEGNILADKADASMFKSYVIDEGNSGGWRYRKWNNGTYECWKYNWGSSGAFAAWGSLYYRDIDGPTFPITFTQIPIVNLTPSDSQAYILGMYSVSTTKIGKIRFGHNNTNAVNSVANIYVIGNWK